MTEKFDREAVTQHQDIKIVPATDDESTEYWLVSGEGAEFPVSLGELHDLMHALHDLHDQAHHH